MFLHKMKYIKDSCHHYDVVNISGKKKFVKLYVKQT